MKYDPAWMEQFRLESPLAEGRELKSLDKPKTVFLFRSPLAEGRELKYKGHNRRPELAGRPSRRGVN